MKLTTDKLELRGLVNQVSKKTGSVYYIMYCETMEGKPVQFICRDGSIFPEGLKKGTFINLVVEYNSYKELSVVEVLKAVD